MRTLVFIAALMVASPAMAFENPDGTPGTFAVQPFFNRLTATQSEVSVGTQSQKLVRFSFSTWSVGMGGVFPVINRATLFANVAVGKTTETFEVSQGVMSTEKRPNFSVAVSVRIWFDTNE